MYLLDTNIILELLLDQDRADEVDRFLHTITPDRLRISEFSLYSLGVLLIRRRMQDTFSQMVDDLLLAGGISLIRLGIEDMMTIVATSQRFGLDFDDAYQYVVAERYGLTIVSFDADFDKTELGRIMPAQAGQG